MNRERILRTLTLAVAGIAAVSLGVAGILIMNVMLVSVSQRTPEIGLLKALGASNPLADRPSVLTTRSHIVAASAAYEAMATDPDGRIRATLEIVWMSGWAPHESQQKPLKPGSAEVSLTKVLGGRG